MASTPVNTANTLSVAFRPGQDLRFPNTSSEAIFTFGDYRIERSSEPDNITGDSKNLSFTPFSTLENLGATDFNPTTYTSIQNNELKPLNSDPHSYSYFGSFYTEIARSINNVLDNFPYAALAYDDGVSNTVYDYSQTYNATTGGVTANFKIPSSVITNQGSIFFNSGSTVGNQYSLMTQTNMFEIQVSGETETYKIESYSYTGGTTPVLEFTILGSLLTGTSTTTSTAPIYIRPSRERFTNYKLQLSRLENQLLYSGRFDIPDVDDEKRDFTYIVPWPKTIDGFNPDTDGSAFDAYKDNILLLAGNVHLNKTDIMIKTVIPENYLDFDTDTEIYKKLISSYAKQFDEIKNFIDNIAYGHTITYDGEENIPDKFLVKLSNLLGWKLSSSFSEIDLFEYLADDENSEQNSFAYYNVEIWRRILVNINWLYKKKGTRDAIQFIFKLIGAPDCLISFDEFVYDINSTLTSSVGPNNSVSKSNSRGFINYDTSQYIFQEGGKGRGDGQRYINQWRPEFNPIKRADNVKVQVGLTAFTGSENVVNTKEVVARLDPAKGVECDVFEWYQLSGTCWVWGSPLAPPFSANTVPFEYAIPNCDFVNPSSITGMTLNDYIKYIYSSNIETRNRKTNSQVHTSWGYPELKRIYLNYFYLSQPISNRLTIKKLEAYLNLLEVNFNDYLFQLIPATSILEHGTVYRNTIFHRQRFVYKEGINDGSEFQVSLPPEIRPVITPVQVNSVINDFLQDSLTPIVINSGVSQGINPSITAVKIVGYVNQNNLSSEIDTFDMDGVIQIPITQVTQTPLP